MTTEPFSPESGADPASGTASITPVTPEMMDRAAHAAAEQADAVAHEASKTPSEAHGEPAKSVGTAAPKAETPPHVPETAVAANENAAEAGEADAVAAFSPLQEADLAFTHGANRNEQKADRSSRAAAASFDGVGLLNAKVMEIAAANVAAAGELISSLIAAKTIPEAASVNAQYMRRAFETLTQQGRELMILGQKVVLDAARSSGEGPRKR